MTFALTRFKAYAVESSEPLQKRFIQRVEMDVTGANTDVAYDFGDVTAGSLGTFWTAVSATQPGTTALKAWRDIAIYAKAFLWAGGLGLTGKASISGAGGSITAYTSAASAGGAATEAVTVTGLAATDTILAVSQIVKGANSTALNGYGTQIADGLTLSWTANPGAGSQAVVLVRKATAAVTPVSGQYSLTLDATVPTLPNLLFASGNAPTVAYLVFEWELTDAGVIVEASA